MKKLSIFSLLIFLYQFSLAQIPTEYSFQDIHAISEKYRILSSEWDYVIPVEERMPIKPTVSSLADGNWGNDGLGITKNYNEINKASKRKVAIFVLDTAPKLDHPFLKDVAWNALGKSFTGETTIRDGSGHGTHVAGIIGAKNGDQPLGICRPMIDKNLLKIIPVEVLNDEGSGSHSWIARGIDYSRLKADSLQRKGWFCILSMSLGGGGSSSVVETAMKKAKDLGMFITVASGNTYNEGVQFPAKSEHAYAIGSIDQDGKRSRFSTYGPELWMASPGSGILSTYLNNQLASLSGTSMATPHQAGLVAIAASVHPELSAGELELLLHRSATDIDPDGWDGETGWGYNYVGRILDYESEVPDDEPVEEPEEDESSLLVGNRMVEVVLPGEYQFVYQSGGGMFKEVTVANLFLTHKSKTRSDILISDLSTKVDRFFQSRAVTIRDNEDALDAGYWISRFLSIYFKKEYDLKVNVKYMIVTDEKGNHGLPTPPPFLDLFTKSRRSTFTY